ncbi:MAG TPA: hypothetical protein VGG76_04185 [Gemmatimonadaceae bacterium]|jgi:hypothetical protein
MAMNVKKVVIGGLVAGVVINVIDFISNYALAARMNAETDAFKPGLSASMSTTSALVSYIIMDFALGIALIWTYAAIRPRFGPGPRTAAFPAILFWLLAMIYYAGYRMMGMMSPGLWWTLSFIGLVNYLVASAVGAKIYSEEAVT